MSEKRHEKFEVEKKEREKKNGKKNDVQTTEKPNGQKSSNE